MALQDIITDFQSILLRDDCSAIQAQTFCVQAMERIQRELRIPGMERQNITLTTGVVDWITVPPDLLEIIDVLIPDQSGEPKALLKKSYRSLMRIRPNAWPSAYARLQAQLWFRGQVPTGTNIQLIYYGQFTPLASLTAENELTTAAPDLVTYGALSFAGDAFQHDSRTAWEARYMQILGQMQTMAIDLEMNGGLMEMQPAYGDDW